MPNTDVRYEFHKRVTTVTSACGYPGCTQPGYPACHCCGVQLCEEHGKSEVLIPALPAYHIQRASIHTVEDFADWKNQTVFENYCYACPVCADTPKVLELRELYAIAQRSIQVVHAAFVAMKLARSDRQAEIELGDSNVSV